MYNKALHWFAAFTAVCTFFLIIAGGLVTSTGSGLAVPDWPLSYGQLMPPMVGGIFYEHGHRMVATAVGMLTVILSIWLWKKERRRWLRFLGLAALATVLLQGALGGLTVLFMLPTVISATHATLAQSFFCIVSAIALFTSRWWIENGANDIKLINQKTSVIFCIIITLMIYIQLILGAAMRHTASGLAVPDVPLAYGQIIPALTTESMEQYNKLLIYEDVRLAADGPISAAQIIMHLVHRYWAVVVFFGVLLLAIHLRRTKEPMYRLYSNLLISLVLAQVLLGIFTVMTRRSVEVATAHVAVGALLLMSSVVLTLCMIKGSARFTQKSTMVQSIREVLV